MAAQRADERVIRGGVIALAAGAAVCVLIPVLAGVGLAWWPSIQLVGYLLAAVAMSGVIGFIFGLPRARAESTTSATRAIGQSSKVRFEANSNLEQISDWLTKLLVGAGLVQLALLPSFLRKVGEYLGNSLGFTGGPPAAVAVVLYGAGVGFIIVYLWTRLRLRVLLELSEVEARGQWEQIEDTLLDEEQASPSPKSARQVSRTVEEVSRIARSTPRFAPVLWVDDNPGNNHALAKAFRDAGIDVLLALSTQEAMQQINQIEFGVVITDFGRREDGHYVEDAGLRFIQMLRERLQSPPPVIVYTGSRGLRNAQTLSEAGARLVTSSPSELFESVVKTLASSAD